MSWSTSHSFSINSAEAKNLVICIAERMGNKIKILPFDFTQGRLSLRFSVDSPSDLL
jgi:hypothetical protein